MQRKEKEIIKSSFPIVWETLTSAEKIAIRSELTQKMGISYRTVTNWSNGVQPVNIAMKKSAANIIGRVLGVQAPYLVLFP